MLKETRHSYFCVNLKLMRFMSLHYIFSDNSTILKRDTFHRVHPITALLSFLKIFSLKKALTYFSQSIMKYSRKLKSKGSISEGLHVSF